MSGETITESELENIAKTYALVRDIISMKN